MLPTGCRRSWLLPPRRRSAAPHLIADGQTPIYAQGWLTQRRYEDEDVLAWGVFSAEQQAFIDCFNANIGDTCPQVTEWTEKRAALCDIAMRGKWGIERWAEFWRYVRDECRLRVGRSASSGC
jgi:hypothetical protein